MFKKYWESSKNTPFVTKGVLKRMVQLAFSNKTLQSYELLKGGCCHLNFKVKLSESPQPYVLRIYNRSPDSVEREYSRSQTFKNIIPLPDIYFKGVTDSLHFSIQEFKPGIQLSELLLSSKSFDLEGIMFEVGQLLSKITTFPYTPSQRFFIADKELTKGYQKFFNDTILNCHDKLSFNEKEKIEEISHTKAHLIPHDFDHLTHGDFNPANILVVEDKGTWKISALLDWEFSFPGHYLWDVSNMLRYKHQMAKPFETSFLSGITENGIPLPTNWEEITTIMNILSLLDCLERTDSVKQPQRYADIKELISYFLFLY